MSINGRGSSEVRKIDMCGNEDVKEGEETRCERVDDKYLVSHLTREH